jgi:hypothetical protein
MWVLADCDRRQPDNDLWYFRFRLPKGPILPEEFAEYGSEERGPVATNSIYRRVLCRIGGLRDALRAARIFPLGCRGAALAGLSAVVWLACSDLALAKNPTITTVAISGTNADLAVTISGSGFGTLPTGLCTSCTTPYLNITDSQGYGCQLFNITSWTDSAIAFNGLQGNPGDYMVVFVTNPQTGLVGVWATGSIPRSIKLASPKIASVSFAGSIGPDLQMTIMGSGFGASPLGLDAATDLPFISFVDKPFEAEAWQAGYGEDPITLRYGSWSDNQIVVLGFGGKYGLRGHTVSPDDLVAIAVANSATCGLDVNAKDASLGPTSGGAVWGGRLP